MVVKAICTNGRSHTMYKDIDSFKLTYDSNNEIHMTSKGNRFIITAEKPFEEDKYGLVKEYDVKYSDDKRVHITQPDRDIWEFVEE